MCRCLTEIHCHTTNYLASNKISSFLSNYLTSTLPQTGSLKRLKTLSNLSMHFQLYFTDSSSNLFDLIKSLNNDEEDSNSLNKRKSKCMPLLNPECKPYQGPRFESFQTLLNKYNKNIHHNYDLSKRDHTLEFIREILEFPAPDLMIPFSEFR